MREILFRGKRTDNCEWAYGAPTKDNHGEMVMVKSTFECDEYNCRGANCLYVDENTVGQYTGLKDKNDKMIFEGDIVKNEWCFIKGNSIVRFGKYKSLDSSNDNQCGHLGFYLEHVSDFNKRIVRKDIMYFANKCEIVGNIHDNPELLGGESNG